MRKILAASFLFCSALVFAASPATNTPLRDLGLFTKYGESAEFFDDAVIATPPTNNIGVFLKSVVDTATTRATNDGKSAQSIGSMRGHWLEWATLVALKRRGLTPAYWQAEFATVPNNFNDVMLWTKEHGPIIISCKTSLRERYKQADLEAVALRQHYPNAKFFLLTLDADKRHVTRVRKKITEKELLALHAVYDETNTDELFRFLKTLALLDTPDKVLRSGKTIR